MAQGLRFDGISNNVLFNQSIVGFGLEGGYELRFKNLNPINGSFMLGGNANVRTYIQVSSGGTLSVTKGNPAVGATGSAPLLDSLEHTASLFWKNGTYYFYVDGTLVESLSFSDTSDASTVRLGSHTGGTGPFSSFTALQFRQYNRLLSAREVAANHVGIATRMGLVGEWLFQAGTGSTAFDTSGNGYNGTITGATWVQPKKQQGLKFFGVPGTSDKVSFPISASLNPSVISVEISITPNQLAMMVPLGMLPATGPDTGWNFKLRDTGSIWFRVGVESANNNAQSPINLYVPNQRIHLIGTYDGSVISLYANGVLVASGVSPRGLLSNPNTPLQFGTDNTVASGENLNGSIHYVRMYNRALSAAEIAANYAGNVTKTGLVGEWLFNEGTGTSVTDTSGNGNRGTIAGATWLVKKNPQKPKKNVFDNKVWSGGFWNADGSLTANLVWRAYPDWIKVKAGTYTVSSSIPSLVGGNVYDKNGVVVANINSFPTTFTLTLDSELHFHVRRSDNAVWDLGSNSSDIKLQLESGTNQTIYEPFTLIDGSKPAASKPKKQMLPPFTDPRWTLHENTRMQVADFSGKVSGSTVENPHKFYRSNNPTGLTSPVTLPNTVEQVDSAINVLDGSVSTTSYAVNTWQAQHLFSFNIVEHIIRKFGASVFGSALTLADRVAWVKAGNVARVACNWTGFGSGPAGNKATLALWYSTGNNYAGFKVTNTSSVPTKLTLGNRDFPYNMTDVIDVNGFVHFNASADASDGITASAISTDKAELEVYLTEAAYTPLRQAYTLGLNANAANQHSTYNAPCTPNTPYSLSSIGSPWLMWFLDGSQNFISAGLGGGLITTPYQFTTPSNCYYIKILASNGGTTSGQFTFDKPQLEPGSVATAFEAYQLLPDNKLIPLVPKKNWCPTDISAWEQGDISSGSGLNTVSTAYIRTINKYSILPSTLYFGKCSGPGSAWLHQYRADGSYIGQTSINNSLAVTTDPACAQVRFELQYGPPTILSQNTLDFIKFQFELGSVATPFEAYKLIPNVKQL